MKVSRILTIALFATGLVFAQGTATAPAKSAAPAKAASARTAPAVKSFTGSVVSVDAIGNSLVVKNAKGTEETFAVDSSTKIKINGKAGKLDELQSGEAVSVSYKKEADKNVAVKITKKAAAAPKKSSAAPKAGTAEVK